MTPGSLHLSRALDDLRTRMGVCVSDLTVDEIAELVHACDRCANPFREVNADAAGFPVRVCDGVYFWRLTIGASVWLDEYAGPLLGESDSRYKMALVYALVHARDQHAFEDLRDLESITEAIRQTAARITATTEELNEALDIVLHIRPDTRRGEVSRAATDWSAICCRLESQTGIPAAEWIWHHSSAYAVKAYNDLHEFANAYHGGTSSTMRDELDEANEDLQLLKVRIMKRARSGDGRP